MEKGSMSLSSSARFFVTGAAAGAASAFVFTAIHGWMISDIWYTLAIMLTAGAACGGCVAWSYRLMFDPVRHLSWWTYNALHVGLLVLLGVASLVVYEPVTTVAAVLEADSPRELTRLAAPLSIAFTLCSALLIHFLWGSRLLHFGAALLTCALLVFLLGINVSVLGLVEMTSTAWYLVALMIGLFVALDAVFAAVLSAIEWRAFRASAAGVMAETVAVQG